MPPKKEEGKTIVIEGCELCGKCPEILYGWDAIARELWPFSMAHLKRHYSKELQQTGVVSIEIFGRRGDRNNPWRVEAWTYRSTFKAWVLLRNQRKYAKKQGKK